MYTKHADTTVLNVNGLPKPPMKTILEILPPARGPQSPCPSQDDITYISHILLDPPRLTNLESSIAVRTCPQSDSAPTSRSRPPQSVQITLAIHSKFHPRLVPSRYIQVQLGRTVPAVGSACNVCVCGHEFARLSMSVDCLIRSERAEQLVRSRVGPRGVCGRKRMGVRSRHVGMVPCWRRRSRSRGG